MDGYYSNEQVRLDVPTVGASQSNVAVSKEFRISYEGSLNLRIDMKCGSSYSSLRCVS
jgi:hypothetical protein